MFQTLKAAFQDRDIRRRIFFTLGMLIVFRIGAHITVPGVNAQAIQTLANSGLFGLLNTFGGGALQNYSIFSLGVSPYITAQIVMQLLQMEIIPIFTEWSKQGEVGRRKINKWTRYLSVAVGFMQAIALSVGFNSLSQFGLVQNPSFTTYLLIALVMTAGTMFVVWVGEQITQFGIGNGVSLIIFSGIVARIPKDIYTNVQKYFINAASQDALMKHSLIGVGLLLAMLLLITLVVYINQAERQIPVRYAKRANAIVQKSHMPLKINSAGVIPVIFASSFIMVPQTVLGLLRNQFGEATWYQVTESIFDLQKPAGMVIYALIIILFTFFYSHIQINPERVAENFQKSGAYIPSVRPGLATERYIGHMLNKLSTVGSIFLMAISVLPLLASYFFGLSRTFGLGGTSLLIVVGVALDTAKQIEGRLIRRRYVGFIH